MASVAELKLRRRLLEQQVGQIDASVGKALNLLEVWVGVGVCLCARVGVRVRVYGCVRVCVLRDVWVCVCVRKVEGALELWVGQIDVSVVRP